MTISELCIRRPVMTILLSMATVVAGVIAYTKIPVAAYVGKRCRPVIDSLHQCINGRKLGKGLGGMHG